MSHGDAANLEFTGRNFTAGRGNNGLVSEREAAAARLPDHVKEIVHAWQARISEKSLHTRKDLSAEWEAGRSPALANAIGNNHGPDAFQMNADDIVPKPNGLQASQAVRERMHWEVRGASLGMNVDQMSSASTEEVMQAVTMAEKAGEKPNHDLWGHGALKDMVDMGTKELSHLAPMHTASAQQPEEELIRGA